MFEGIGALFAGGAADAAGGVVAAAALDTAAVTLPTMAVTATSLAGGAAGGLTLAGLGGVAGAAAAGYSALTAQDLHDIGYEFPNPMSDADVAKMTKDAGTSIGLEDKGFSWVDGLGWAKTALGLAGAGMNAYGQYRAGQNAAGNATAAANDSRLSAEDAKRRADQLEQWGLGQSKIMQPWDENGGRAMAGEQLKALLSDPAGVAANDPAYKLRMQAASRAMGIYGQDSGAMGVAAADASSTWYDQRLQQLSGISGATTAPGAGGQLGLQTLTGSANIAGMGQASGAFGHQAAGAADNARNRANAGLINSAGQIVDAAGRLIGGSGSGGGSNLSIGVTGNGGNVLGDTPVDNSSLRFGTLPGPLGQNTNGIVAGGNTPLPPDGRSAPITGMSAPVNYDETWQPPQQGTQGPLQFQGSNPTLPGASSLGSGPYAGPLQQMQGMGQPLKGQGEAHTQWPFRDPDSNPAPPPGPLGTMSQIGQPTGPGQVPRTATMPNAQGNGTAIPRTDSPNWQDGLLQQLGGNGAGGDLLGDYLNPRMRAGGGG